MDHIAMQEKINSFVTIFYKKKYQRNYFIKGGVVQWLEQWNHKSAIYRKLF